MFLSGVEDSRSGAATGGRGERGETVMWTADTIRVDGTRVVVSAFNAGNQESAATRATPALTMKELRTIALSPKWHELLK